MHKIRPTRILSGFTKAAKTAITGNEEDFVKQRKKYCFEPCEHNKGGTCQLCGCVLLAKTQKELEYCPDNRWEDIKILEEKGIAIRNLSPEKVILSYVSPSQLQIEYNDGIGKDTDTNIEIQIINDRANATNNNIKENLTGLRVQTSCGCTSTTEVPKTLIEGHSFTFGVSYKRGNKAAGKFAQTIGFKSNEENFFIRLKGNRI